MTSSSFVCLRDSPSTIVYDLPFGRLNPQRAQGGAPLRIAREGCGPVNCFYVALERLRAYEAPGYKATYAEDRFEAAFYEMRQETARHEASLPSYVQHILCTKTSEPITHEVAKRELNVYTFAYQKLLAKGRGTKTQKEHELLLTGCQEWRDALTAFLAQNRFSTLEDFLLDWKIRKRGEIIIKKMVDLFHFTLPQIANEMCLGDSSPQADVLRALSDFTQSPVKHWGAKVQKLMQWQYVCFWKIEELSPENCKSIDKLIKTLKERGPLACNGHIGINTYNDAPKKLSETCGARDVYGWAVGASKVEPSELFTHVVTVIGAVKTTDNRAYVYFIDPCDPSDSKNPTLEKVYRISFQNFSQKVQFVFARPKENLK